MIHVEHLSKKFGDLEVLKDINLDVEEGEEIHDTFRRCQAENEGILTGYTE